jgi:hypothetical protein
MKCEEVRNILSRFQDRELDKKREAQVQEHLFKCEQCNQEMELLDLVVDRVTKISEVDVPPNFSALVMNKVHQKEKHRYFSLSPVFYSFIFIIFAIVLFMFSVNFMKNGQEKTAQFPIFSKASDLSEYSNILAESQYLSLMEVQDKTIDMLVNGRENER